MQQLKTYVTRSQPMWKVLGQSTTSSLCQPSMIRRTRSSFWRLNQRWTQRQHRKKLQTREKKQEDKERLEAIKKEEFVRLEKHSENLRQYLMQFVVPTLTTGLIDVC